MKAVKAFKKLLARKRPERMNGILGRDTRIVQPPLSIRSNNKPAAQVRSTKSFDNDDRRPVEQALASEGVHREIDLSLNSKPLPNREDVLAVASPKGQKTQPPDLHDSTTSPRSPTSKRETNVQPKDHRPKRSSTDDHGKGHAHDPLEDHLFLAVGPGGGDEIPDPPAVSESPAAAESNIYETAYHEEIERIRCRSGTGTTLYLTRRVEKKKEYQDDENLIGMDDESPSQPKGGLGKILGLMKKKEKEQNGNKIESDGVK